MQGRLALAGLCATLLVALGAGRAQAANDDFEAASPLFFGTTETASNAAATSQPQESLTPQGSPGLDKCVAGPIDHPAYSQADKTLWWWVNGTGRPITISTAGSDFDTQLGIFSGPLSGAAICQDADLNGESVTFDSVAGHPYRIQVGGCILNTDGGCQGAGPTGVIHVSATTPPPANDERAAPAPLPTGQPVSGDNYGAGEERSESIVCDHKPYGRTVWYRWTAASAGSLQVTVSAPAATVAVFDQAGNELGCAATPGGSRLTVPVSRGEHLVQIGGLGAHAGLSGDSAQAWFTVQASLTAGGDRDNDGVLDAASPAITSRALLSVRHFRTYAKVTALSVRSVPAGSRVELRCSGRSCPFRRTRSRTVARARPALSLMTASLRSARIVPPTTLQVRVTRAGRIGRITSFQFLRAGRDPVERVRCLPPGATVPTRCPR